ATSVAPGSTAVQATVGSISGTATLTVTSSPPVSITVTPANPIVAVGLTQQFTAIGKYADNSTRDLTSTATWSSEDATIGTISSTGLATTVAPGITAIQAKVGSLSGGAVLGVTPFTLSPSPLVFARQLVGTGSAAAITTLTNVGNENAIVSILASGDFTQANNCPSPLAGGARCPIAVKFVPTAPGLRTGAVTVLPPDALKPQTAVALSGLGYALTSISVTPVGATIPLGLTQQFTATGTSTDGVTEDVTGIATWSS